MPENAFKLDWFVFGALDGRRQRDRERERGTWLHISRCGLWSTAAWCYTYCIASIFQIHLLILNCLLLWRRSHRLRIYGTTRLECVCATRGDNFKLQLTCIVHVSPYCFFFLRFVHPSVCTSVLRMRVVYRCDGRACRQSLSLSLILAAIFDATQYTVQNIQVILLLISMNIVDAYSICLRLGRACSLRQTA